MTANFNRSATFNGAAAAAAAAAAQATATTPLSLLKSFRPYYSPTEIRALVRLNSLASSSSRSATINPQTGRKELSEQRVESSRQLACGYIERVGNKLGFPRRTIATAQTLWNRFHLHYQIKDFPYQDVSLSAILVAAKVEDTLKKLRDIQIAGYQVTNIMEGGQGTSEGDGSAQEAHRPNLIAIERLVLQTICFNFHLHRSLPPTSSSSVPPELLALTEASTTQSRDIFTYTVRFCRALAAPKPFAFLAHLIAIDLHRTLAPLTYPPHTCAVASIYLASFMFHGHSNTTGWMGTSAQELSGSGSGPRGPELKDGWMDELESNPDDVRAIVLDLLDLFVMLCPPAPELISGTLFSNAVGTPNEFSPVSVLASPVEVPITLAPPTPISSSSTTTAATTTTINTKSAKTVEREKYLLQTGVPHTLAMGWAGHVVAPHDNDDNGHDDPHRRDETGENPAPTSSTSPAAGCASVFAVRNVEDFTRIKIRLRELAAIESAARAKRAREEEPEEQGEEQEKESGGIEEARTSKKTKVVDRAQDDYRRWAGSETGLVEIQDKQQEIEEKELEKALLKEEREKGSSLGQPGAGDLGARQTGVTSSRPKPTSVLYRF